jgi:hypothetical protein
MNQAAAVSNDPHEESTPALSRVQFWGLMILSALAYFATSLITQFVGYFTEPGFNSSILMDPRKVVLVILTIIWIALVGGVATFVGRFIRPDAGLFVAAAALWSLRRSGGMARDVYLAHPTGSTFISLAIELVILGLILGFVFFLTRQLVAKGKIPDDADIDLIRPRSEPLGQRLLATATTALVMMVLLLLTLRSDERMQVTGMVFVSALLATMSTVRFIPATPSIYFWAGPIVVGIVGYLASSVRGTGNLPIGDVAGYFGALARAMPLDYASAGVAGSLYGYWVARGWIPEDALEAEKA